MLGGGENWVSNPWDWITSLILLFLAEDGANPITGSEGGGDGWA